MNKIINIVLAVALGIAILMGVNQCQRANASERDAASLWNDITELAETTRDKEGRLTTKLESVTLSSQSLLKELAQSKTDIEGLKGKIQSISKINRTIRIHDSTETVITLPGDTIRTDSFIYIYPKYTDLITSKWMELSIEMDRLSTKFDLSMKDSLSFIHTKQRKLFKRDVYNVHVQSANPYVEKQDVESYQILEEKPKRWSLGVQVGYGFVNITDPTNIKLCPYAGLGINYSLLRW